MNWYPAFLLTILALWAFSSPRDRVALRIVVTATLGSELLVDGVTSHIVGAWKLAFPATVETLTILAMLRYSPNLTGYMQAGCLAVAWLAHLGCYLDILFGTNVVYDRYEAVLGLVALTQILSFHDTIKLNIRRLGHWCYSRGRGAGALRTASVSPALLHDPGVSRL